MTIDGIGETRSLADAFSLFAFMSVPTRSIFCCCYLESDLRRIIAVTPEFWPRRSLLNLVGVSLPFHSAAHFFCRSRAASCPALCSLFRFGILVGRNCLLLRGGRRNELRHPHPTASAAANTALGMFFFLYFQSQGALPVGNRPQSATGAQR
jgi:hypothetical protein